MLSSIYIEESKKDGAVKSKKNAGLMNRIYYLLKEKGRGINEEIKFFIYLKEKKMRKSQIIYSVCSRG